jgi:hypothetical protein
VATSQISVTRVAGSEGLEWERQEGTKPYLFVALGGEVVDRGGLPARHRAGGGCGWWWWRSGEGEGVGTGGAASM